MTRCKSYPWWWTPLHHSRLSNACIDSTALGLACRTSLLCAAHLPQMETPPHDVWSGPGAAVHLLDDADVCSPRHPYPSLLCSRWHPRYLSAPSITPRLLCRDGQSSPFIAVKYMLVRVWWVSALLYEYGKGFTFECLRPYQCHSRVVSWEKQYTTRLKYTHIQCNELSTVNVTAGLLLNLAVGPFIRLHTGAVDSTTCFNTGKLTGLSYQACHKCIDCINKLQGCFL